MTKTAKKSSKAKDKKPMIARNETLPPVKSVLAQETAPTEPHRHPLATPGMGVECMIDECGPWYGIIVHCLPEACIVRLDDERQREEHEEESARIIALQWNKVLLRAPRPAGVKLEETGVAPAVRPIQRRIYKEPSSYAEALVTSQRLMRHYEAIEAIILDVQKEDNTEWEGDAVDKLYSAQTILIRAATTLAHHYDLVATIKGRPNL